MHDQKAFADLDTKKVDYSTTLALCRTVLALPIHPYMEDAELKKVCDAIESFIEK